MLRKFIAGVAMIATLLAGGVITADHADAAWPVGTVLTYPNVLAPGGTWSCWENQLNTSTSRMDCVKYNFPGAVVQTWQAFLPTWCKGVVLAAGNATTPARLLIAHRFWNEEVPSAEWAGGHGGCTPAFNQNGSQAWAHTYVTPAGCVNTGCTVVVGFLSGGSWWGPNTAQHPVSRQMMTGYGGIVWPNGQTYGTHVFLG